MWWCFALYQTSLPSECWGYWATSPYTQAKEENWWWSKKGWYSHGLSSNIMCVLTAAITRTGSGDLLNPRIVLYDRVNWYSKSWLQSDEGTTTVYLTTIVWCLTIRILLVILVFHLWQERRVSRSLLKMLILIQKWVFIICCIVLYITMWWV